MNASMTGATVAFTADDGAAATSDAVTADDGAAAASVAVAADDGAAAASVAIAAAEPPRAPHPRRPPPRLTTQASTPPRAARSSAAHRSTVRKSVEPNGLVVAASAHGQRHLLGRVPRRLTIRGRSTASTTPPSRSGGTSARRSARKRRIGTSRGSWRRIPPRPYHRPACAALKNGNHRPFVFGEMREPAKWCWSWIAFWWRHRTHPHAPLWAKRYYAPLRARPTSTFLRSGTRARRASCR